MKMFRVGPGSPRAIAFDLVALFLIALLPRCVLAAGTQTIKQINGPPPITLPTITVPGVYMPPPAPTFDVSSLATFYSGGGLRAFNGGGEFSFNNKTATTDKKKDKAGCQGHVGDPIEVDDGAKLLSIPLFQMPGEMGLKYFLYYQSVTGSSVWDYSPWRTSLDYDLDLYCGFTDPNVSCSKITLYRPDGSSVSFSGNHYSYGNFPEIGGGGLATLVHNSNGTWTLHDEDSTVQKYSEYGYLTSIKDVSGIGWTISSTSTSTDAVSPDGTIVPPCREAMGVGTLTSCPNPPPPPTTTTTTVVTHTDGQSFTIVEVAKNAGTDYASGSVTVTDPAGNKYSYSLGFYPVPNSGGLWAEDVASLTFPGSPATTMTFSYTGANQLLSGVSYNGTAYWSTSYNSNNEVSSDGAADGTEQTSIEYSATSGRMAATITNPLGMTTTNTYTTDSQGNYLLASVSNSAVLGCGSTTNSMAWDANDNLTRTIDNDGVTHTYDYAANGQLQTETEAYGTALARTTNYRWDPDAQLNRMLSMTILAESRISYTYNAQNRLASVTRTNLTGVGTPNQSLTTTYAYTLYGDGMVDTVTVTEPSPNGRDKTTYAYDTHGNLTSVADGLGYVTTYSNYNALGKVGKVVGPNGDETDYTYDPRGRVASKTMQPYGPKPPATWTYAYDGFGLLASISAPDAEVTTWTRDAEMRVKTVTHNDKDGTSTETFGYDANDDVISDVIARGSDIGKETTYVYNALGKVYQVKGSHGQVLTYGYDGNGNVRSVTDALGHKTTYAYDVLNRVASVTNAADGVTYLFHDAGDHVTHVTDPRGLVTSYAWDGLGQLWQQNSPDTGTTNFVYNADGRLASKTRADGTQITYTYDALNRLTSKTAGGVTHTYTWDSCTWGKGRLCTSTTNADSVNYSYTPRGWITDVNSTIQTNGTTFYIDVGYSYDNMGHVTAVWYPDYAIDVDYHYTNGVVDDVEFSGAGNNGVTRVTYRPMDLAMSGWTIYNGLPTTIGYDSDLRPTSISVPGVESMAFSYDAANRITYIANGMHASDSQALGYDPLARLTSVSSGVDKSSYSYDAGGNRTYQVVNGTASSFAYSPNSNRLTSVSGGMNATYGYDADGNTATIDGHTAYTYGPFNRLVNASGTEYVYGPEGHRVEKTSATGTTYFARDPSGALLAEYENGVWTDYVWLNGKLVAGLSYHGGIYSVHSDQTGRPLAITDTGNQSVLWEAEGLPFTRNVTANTFGQFNLGFPGQYYDSESGLWHNGYRDYDAALGRYIESDPIGLAGGNNTYAYVGDNPITSIDPSGLCPKCAKPPALPSGASVKSNIQQIQMDRAFAGPALIFTFYNFVRNGGPWDYKQQNTYPQQYDAAGNFNYGATGVAAGFSTQLLLRAAGYAQIEAGTSTPAWRGLLGPLGGPPYGDDPADQAEIKAGMAYYNCLASGGQ